MDLPLAFAFTAGLVATLNPCGFAMLPAYLGYFLGLDEAGEAPAAVRAAHALRVGSVVSLGFLAVFGIAGLLIATGVRVVIDALPWIALIVGAALVVVGTRVALGHPLRLRLPTAGSGPARDDLGGMIGFGVSYAVASLSCTLPVFLVVVAGSIPRLGIVGGLVTFLVYGAGMAVLLLAVTVAIAFGKQALIGHLRRASAHVGRVAGGILALAGIYIVVFWVTTLRTSGASQLAIVRGVEGLSSRAVNAVSAHVGAVSVAIISVVFVAAAAAWWSRRRSPQAEGSRARRTARR
ncbi:MAG: cytochrome c biogenesis protein CcdA [Nitriliruptoraceae bacterium]